jgi:8-oxo-dGTP diphosphatase
VGSHRTEQWRELDRWDRASIAVDCVLLTVIERQLHVLVHRRPSEPFAGEWALPGAFLSYGIREDDLVIDVVKEKAGVAIDDFYREHLDWNSEPGRDERGWVVAHMYLALAPAERLAPAVAAAGQGAILAPVVVPWGSPAKEAAVVLHPDGRSPLAFDHDQIVGQAVQRLRGKLRYTALALEFVPDEFPLRDLERVYEVILGERLSRATFQKLVLDDLAIVEPTGDREPAGTGRRRAQLFRAR